MPSTTAKPGTSVADIFGRVWDGKAKMSATVARQVLKLGLDEADVARSHELARKCSAGTLTPAEAEEYDGYILVGAMMAILHSKARMVLKLPPPFKTRKRSA